MVIALRCGQLLSAKTRSDEHKFAFQSPGQTSISTIFTYQLDWPDGELVLPQNHLLRRLGRQSATPVHGTSGVRS